MMSTGFSWGAKPLDSASNDDSNTHTSIPRYTLVVRPVARKRKLHDEESKVHKPASNNRRFHAPARHKKTKTPRIVGQPLPIHRLIEVLDHKSLQTLLEDLVKIHPETANTIHKLSPKPCTKSSIALIREKFDNIINHLPYKCDVESDYSYLRVKPHINEFLNCLSDFILNLLPPIETNISRSVEFLDMITNLIHELPNFTNHEFQYTRSMAYEQISNTWLIVLSQRFDHPLDDDSIDSAFVSNSTPSSPPSNSSNTSSANLELIKIIEDMNLQSCLEKHNNTSLGKFKLVIDFIKSELDNYEQLSQSLNGGPTNILNDLITVDYSNFAITARTSH